jgi:hypothetical protein
MLLLLNGIALSQTEHDNPYKIDSISIRLFMNTNRKDNKRDVAGAFSYNLADSEGFWNRDVGERNAGDDSEGESDETLVIVEISGNPPGFIQRKLQVEAFADGKRIFKSTRPFSIIDKFHQYYAAFLLYDTGCEKTTIIAKILGRTTESQMKKTIDFRCGE